MALYTEFELNEMMANQIRDLIAAGYSIDPAHSFNNDKSCTALLVKESYSIRLIIRKHDDYIIKSFSFVDKSLDNKDTFDLSLIYYRVYDNTYADSEKEAEDERFKYITKSYEDMYLTGKHFPETYIRLINE